MPASGTAFVPEPIRTSHHPDRRLPFPSRANDHAPGAPASGTATVQVSPRRCSGRGPNYLCLLRTRPDPETEEFTLGEPRYVTLPLPLTLASRVFTAWISALPEPEIETSTSFT
jgi:hypothetical protein